MKGGALCAAYHLASGLYWEKYVSVTVLYVFLFLDFCSMDTRLESGSSIASVDSFVVYFFFSQLSASLWAVCSPDVKGPIDDLTDGGQDFCPTQVIQPPPIPYLLQNAYLLGAREIKQW